MSNVIVPSNSSQSSPFDAIRGYRADGSEYWTARELMKWLGYTRWEQGSKALDRAVKSMANQGHDVTLQVHEVLKLSNQHNSKVSEIVDYELSRFACYVVAMNADPSKEMVAMAQGYFAVQTRKSEVAELSLAQPISIPAILPEVRAVQIADSIRHITDTLDDNPRLAQLLIDLSISGIVEKTNLLPGTDIPQLRGVAEIAAEMKLPVNIKNRGDLGKFIVAAGFTPRSEKRLVNGAMRDVNCYPDTPELREVIKQFFN
jgi:hypothetical protein